MYTLKLFILLLACSIANAVSAQAVNPEVFTAAKQGDQAKVEALLAAGANIAATYKVASQEEAKTLIEYAALSGNLSLVQWLLRQGASLDAATTLEGTLLHQAVRSQNQPLVEWLVAQGLDVNAGNYSGTPLHLAVKNDNQPLAAWLLQQGANINANLEYAGTALHQAAKTGNQSMVEFLVSAGADINLKNSDDKNALLLAFDSKNLDLVRWLAEQGADVNGKPKYYGTPLAQAAIMEASVAQPLMEFLLAHGGNLKFMQGDIIYNAAVQAAAMNNQALLQWLLVQGLDINVANSDGRTPMHAAAYKGNLALAQWLREQGADVHAVTTKLETTLLFAVRGGKLEMVEWLLSLGVNITAVPSTGETLMHAAATSRNVDMINWVAKKKFDVNAIDAGGTTPLISAARGNVETVEALLARKANPDLQNNYGESALLQASYNDTADITLALLKIRAKVDLQNTEGQTALWRAITYGKLDIVEALLAKKANVNLTNKDGRSVFMHAIIDDHDNKTAILDLLLKSADVNARDGSDSDHCPVVMEVVKEGNLKLLEAMYTRKLNINAACDDGETALHFAARGSDPAIILSLINHGADVHARTDGAETPLHYAAGYRDGTREMAELLIAHGADVNALDSDKHGPLYDAISYSKVDVIDLLLARGARDEGNHPALTYALNYGKKGVVEVFLKRGMDVNIKDEWNRTPLILAAEAYDSAEDSVGTVELLIEYGADINARTTGGDTALHNAANAYGKDIAAKKRIIEILLDHGSEAEARGNYGRTPLMNAASRGRNEFIEILLAHNADINAKDTNNGWTALHLNIVGTPQLETIRYLLENNADSNMADNSGNTPLSLTERISDADTRQAIVAILQDYQGRSSGTPEERLAQLLAQFKGHSTNEVLRTSIINLVQGMERSPAVPAEAVALEGRAQVVFKNLQTDKDLLEVAKFYLQAIEIAPWVPDYYYNLCLILEKTVYYKQALHACNLFLTVNPFAPDNELKQIQAVIGGIDYLKNQTIEVMKLRNIYENDTTNESLYELGGVTGTVNGNRIAVRLMTNWQASPPRYQVVVSCMSGTILFLRYDLVSSETYDEMCGGVRIVINPDGAGFVDIGNSAIRTTLDELFRLRAQATARSEVFTKYTDNGVEFYTALVQGGPTNQYIGFAMYRSDCNGNRINSDIKALPDGFVSNEELLSKSWFDMNYLTDYNGQLELNGCASVFSDATGFQF